MKVSICIASHNMRHLLPRALGSCIIQDYANKEIILLDDASTDGTPDYNLFDCVRQFRSEEPSGTGGAFNKAMSHATGDIIVLLCADDIFFDHRVISDIVEAFKVSPHIVHVSRYYHQFIDGDYRPVRAWRGDDVIELANNPSGLAFKRSAIGGCQLSNKMFVEASSLVSCVINNGSYAILPYDTVAVRIHQSISRNKDYYRKRWVSSPIEEWVKVAGVSLLKDFTSLIQIKNYFTTQAVLKECGNFIRMKPTVIFNPAFLFFAAVSILTPRSILLKIPDLYRRTWGRWTTRVVCRPN